MWPRTRSPATRCCHLHSAHRLRDLREVYMIDNTEEYSASCAKCFQKRLPIPWNSNWISWRSTCMTSHHLLVSCRCICESQLQGRSRNHLARNVGNFAAFCIAFRHLEVILDIASKHRSVAPWLHALVVLVGGYVREIFPRTPCCSRTSLPTLLCWTPALADLWGFFGLGEQVTRP